MPVGSTPTTPAQMDLRPLYPHVVSPAVLALPRLGCFGLARTLLLHGVGAHPASRAALRDALRHAGRISPCTCCRGQGRLDACAAGLPATPPRAQRTAQRDVPARRADEGGNASRWVPSTA